jgi:hypothetical protein
MEHGDTGYVLEGGASLVEDLWNKVLVALPLIQPPIHVSMNGAQIVRERGEHSSLCCDQTGRSNPWTQASNEGFRTSLSVERDGCSATARNRIRTKGMRWERRFERKEASSFSPISR